MKKLTLIGLALFLVSASSQLHTQNLILNPGCEDALVNGEIPQWIEILGVNWTQRYTNPDPYSGDAYFFPGVASIAELIQDVNVSDYAVLIDDSLQFFVFEGYVRSWPQNPPDSSRIVIEYLDTTKLIKLDSIDFGNYGTTSSWVQLADTSFAPSGTRFIRIRLISTRNAGSNNDGYYDALILWFCELNTAFTASEDTICVGDNVSFADQSECNIVSWDWTFEGGTPSTSTSQNPTVTYNATGIFDVQLIISDGIDSDTLLNEDCITVLDTPGQADEPDGDTAVCTGNSYMYTTQEVDFAQDYDWELTPSDAGTLEADRLTALFLTAEDWTGDFTIRVRATNICGDGDWSTYLEGTLSLNPDEYTLEGGGGYCFDGDGVEITLDGSQTDVDYELYLDGEATGNIVEGTGSEISFGLVTDEGYYTCIASNDNCSQMMMEQIQVYLLYPPSEPGNPTGPEVICEETTSDYETSGSEDADSYGWMLSPEEAGTITGDSLAATVEWEEDYTGLAYISVYGINACGDGDPSEELEVSVGAPNPEVTGESLVCDWSDEIYEVADNEGSTYTWEVVGGNISEGQGTYMVTVAWEGEGSGTLSVNEETVDGCEGSSEIFDVTIDDCTGVGELKKEGMLTFSPNPFKNSTIIKFQLEHATEVTIHIYNHMGELVDLIEEYKQSGIQKVIWNADKLPSGVYYFRLEAGEQSTSGKVVLVS